MGRGGLVLVLSALLAPAAFAQAGETEAGSAIALGDGRLQAFDTPGAIAAYEAGLARHPDHPGLLRKASLAVSNLAQEDPGRDGNGPLHEKAVRLARRAVKEAPGDARAHAVLAVTLGRYADWLAHERRLAAAATVARLGQEAYRHADRALRIDPDDWVAHAFLGAMHRRLATVPALVRHVARAFLEWPDVSLERSEAHLVKSIREEPDEVTTRIELARTYLEMGREPEARRQLEAALAIQPKDRLDRLEQLRQAPRLRAELD